MTLLIVDPPECPFCPMFYGGESIGDGKWTDESCSATSARRKLSVEDLSRRRPPDWCPLRKGDVVVRFKGGGLARLKEKWDAADALFDLYTRGDK